MSSLETILLENDTAKDTLRAWNMEMDIVTVVITSAIAAAVVVAADYEGLNIWSNKCSERSTNETASHLKL